MPNIIFNIYIRTLYCMYTELALKLTATRFCSSIGQALVQRSRGCVGVEIRKALEDPVHTSPELKKTKKNELKTALKSRKTPLCSSIPRWLAQVKLSQSDEFCHNVPDGWAIAHLAHPLEPLLLRSLRGTGSKLCENVNLRDENGSLGGVVHVNTKSSTFSLCFSAEPLLP